MSPRRASFRRKRSKGKLAFFAISAISWWVPSLPAAQTDFQRAEKGNRITENIPEIPGALSERLQQYQNTRAAEFSGWLADGEGMLITTRFGDTPQVHWVKRAGGAREQLTFYNEPIRGAQTNPTRNGFVFSKDIGGSEFWQLYYFDLGTRAVRLLTDGKSRNEDAVWSTHGDRLAFSTTKRNGADSDVHVVGLDGAPSRAVLERDGTWDAIAWSPDDQSLLVSQYVSIEESRPWIVDLRSGTTTRLFDPLHPAFYSQLTFSREGRGIYYTSDEAGEFVALHYRDLVTGKTHSLSAGIPWDVEGFVLSRDGRHLAFVVNQDGASALHLLELSSGREVPLPQLPQGPINSVSFSPNSQRLSCVLNSSTSPSDIYVIEFANKVLERWTASEVGGLDASRFCEPALVRFPTFDESGGKPRSIPALYYKPTGKGPFPVVIMIHGGPEDQARPGFDSLVQFWVNEMNIAVLRPNVRGSTGYGRTYLSLDNGVRREDAVKDIGALLDWVAMRPELDAKRIGVYGGSYGGFMAMSAMTHFNDRLRAGIELVGQSNFVTFLEHTEAYRRDLRRAEYGDERIPQMRAFLEGISPIANARKIRNPFFVAVGANDPRVPASEGRKIVDAVRENGGNVWFLEFKDEGHGFQKAPNKAYFNAASALFWQNYLLPNVKP